MILIMLRAVWLRLRWLWLWATVGRWYADDYYDAKDGVDGSGPDSVSDKEKERFQP